MSKFMNSNKNLSLLFKWFSTRKT